MDPAAFGDDGAVASSGLVIGTYLHGIFDNQNLRDAFLDFLYERKNSTGIEASGLKAEDKSHRAKAQKGSGYRELAEAVEAHLDMEKVWQMLELEMPEAKERTG
jgi:adenosylcobyric acid synthase